MASKDLSASPIGSVRLAKTAAVLNAFTSDAFKAKTDRNASERFGQHQSDSQQLLFDIGADCNTVKARIDVNHFTGDGTR